MKKPIILTRYSKANLSKRTYTANRTSLNNLEFCLSTMERYLGGMPMADLAEEHGVPALSLAEVMVRFLRLTNAKRAFELSSKMMAKPLRNRSVRAQVIADIAEVRAYQKAEREGAVMPPAPAPEPTPEASTRWDPGLAKVIAATRNVQHILGGGDKDRVQIEQMVMVKRFALGEEVHDLATSYGISVGAVRTRLERGWKQLSKTKEFDTKFMRDYPQEVRIIADNAIFEKLNHIKIDAVTDAQATVVEMRTNLNELVQQKAMIEAELSSQYKDLCLSNAENEDLALQLQTLNGQLAGAKIAYDSVQARLNGVRAENSELKRRLETSQVAQLDVRPAKQPQTVISQRPPRGIFARIRQALTH